MGELGEASVARVGGVAAEQGRSRAVGVDPDGVLEWRVWVLGFGLLGLDRELRGERGGLVERRIERWVSSFGGFEPWR